MKLQGWREVTVPLNKVIVSMKHGNILNGVHEGIRRGIRHFAPEWPGPWGAHPVFPLLPPPSKPMSGATYGTP